MRDVAWRRAVKAVARWHFMINLVVVRALNRRTRYRLAGNCRRCAKCCEEPAVRVGVLVWYLRMPSRIFLWWQRTVNGFHFVRRDPDQHAFVFTCSHFDWQTRSCDSYESRPAMCRDYPRALLDQASPELLPGCGYRAVAPNAPGLLRELEHQGIEGERLVELKRRLHLE